MGMLTGLFDTTVNIVKIPVSTTEDLVKLVISDNFKKSSLEKNLEDLEKSIDNIIE